jgi:basic membrane protein A
MKKLISSLILILVMIFTLSSCKKKTYEIALVTDVGNIDDKSFNEGAWRGVKAFAEERKVTYNYYRPSEDSKNARIESMKSAIEKGAKMIVCPGYLFEEAIYDIQDQYQNVAFLLLDGEPHNADYSVYKTAKNVHCILYQEEQAGYLAGYAAVKEGYRNLGFIGGINVPAVIRFGYGYIIGADEAAQELDLGQGAVKIKYDYAGGFNATDDLKSKMDSWYTGGTEVVFACGGAIYLSVTKAAEEQNKKVIGVDSDQAAESETIITSAMKDLTQSVKLALTSFYENGLKWDDNRGGKTAVLGAKDKAIGLPTAETSWRFTTFTRAEYETIFDKLADGTIVVNNSTTKLPSYSNRVIVEGLSE